MLGIRTSQYLYTDWRNGGEELFDVSSDPDYGKLSRRDPDWRDRIA